MSTGARRELADVRSGLRRLAARVDDAGLRAELLAACAAPEPAAPVPLTARELDVLALAATGRPNAEIAALLATTAAAVKAQLRGAMGKLGVRSRHAAASAARVAGMVP
jgi:LuxR family transcriptional regulator, regulator of acetate metabolism